MALKKTKKRRKTTRSHGRRMGTSGTGARKNERGKGNQGGAGKWVGSGKRADQHKMKIINTYGNDYFGRGGVTSRSIKVDKRDRINLNQIQGNLQTYGKKSGQNFEVSLPGYKILGIGEIKDKVTINAAEASKSAKEKVEKAGGKLILSSENGGSKEQSSENSENK
ncbi:MAG: uL15 family ribosomal protein [Candidatus Pacearchaeota archaeon]